MNIFTKIPQKTIVITEKQLHEAMKDGFSFETLENIGTFKGRKRYCDKYLGVTIGSGSSRVVYSIDDEKCLKLAKNPKGIAQNEAEVNSGASEYEVGPEIFKVADNYSYIVSEYVLPAKPNDFKHCLGISFKDFCDFVALCFLSYADNREKMSVYFKPHKDEDYFYELINKNEFFENLYNYMNYEHIPFGDLTRIANYGMCLRDGKPQIVVLDSGFTMETMELYRR